MNEEEEQKNEIFDWIEAVIKRSIDRSPGFQPVLKDGLILCELMNVLLPGSVKRVNKKGSAFQLRENIAAFQGAAKKFGMPDDEIFQTVDLFENRNIKQVIKSLQALGRVATNKKDYDGPKFGPKMSSENKRNFSEEQIRQGRDAQIGLQAGQNKGASQAGQNMGKQRMIAD
ncbi:DgyrCDS2598 [Dimorphilus gyrociliatus]|uniref:DgyrCDS2598 n=1 Tax=Dimorphilus gyrociliatus TaxID=2664684 RepID=A0A7I8VDK5_9ANNE|nr:DgyrCDS2598 [Dimorphilus gyrociliatus]